MKRSILILFSIFVYFNLYGQNIDYNQIILPESAEEIPIEEKLIQLAWKNNPANTILKNNRQIARHNVTKASFKWLSSINLYSNINEFVIDPGSDIHNRSQFFPMYNVGVSLNLGSLIEYPADRKIALMEEKNEMQMINQQKLYIRSEVLKRYRIYLQYKQIFKIRTETTENALSIFHSKESKFKNGEISFEEYNKAYNDYSSFLTDKIVAQTDYELSKVSLEEIIGVKLDDIFNADL